MKRFVLFLLLFAMGKTALAQVPETEPNNAIVTANPLARYEQKTATITTTDDYDYFRAVLPEDGTMKIYVRATCTGAAGNGWLYFNAYDRRKVNSISDRYIANNTSIPTGVTVYDTITLYGMAADTVYLRFYTSKSFSYQLSYSITDQTTNDAEPNNTVATALPLAINETKAGHQHYFANGDTYDDYDWYRAILPADGTLKLYVDAINQGSSNGWIYLDVYDRRKTTSLLGKYLGNNTSVPRGTGFKDTITLYGMAADTVYFRLYTSGQAFSYNIGYTQTDLTPNDAEPNDVVATALPIAINETKQGHSRYFANGSTYDDYDWYRAILPADGTLKLYVDATNQGGTNGWMYLNVYDRRKVNSIYEKYLGNNTSVPRGTGFKDTITLYGMAADTVYFRFYTNGQAFSYSLHYNQTDLTPNDAEPNETANTALPLALGETKQGHSRYFAAGSTDDDYDYYRITPPYDGTQKIYIEATNQGGSNGWIYFNAYDRRKVNSIFDKYLAGNTSVPRGTTIRDTITLYGQQADTNYIRFYTNGQGFSYKIRYDVADTSTNDAEPNNTFATALDLSGGQPRQGHIGYNYNGTADGDDFYKTSVASNDSPKLYIQATNTSGGAAHFFLYGYNASQNQIYDRYRYNIPAGATLFDSVKIPVTAPQTIYNRVDANGAFSYQLTLNSRLPGNGFSISGKPTACTNATVYKAVNMAPSDAGLVYHWSVNGGGTISFTDSIATVNWTTAGTWIVSLYTSNAAGNSVTKKLSVTVNAGSPPAAPIITVKGRYLDVAVLPVGAGRQWYKGGVAFSTDSVIYAATAGSYTATYVNDCGESVPSAAVSFNAPQAQTISFPPVADLPYSPDSLRKLNATASTGLPITYKIISGPGTVSNDTLRPTGYGSIVVQAMQYGNTNFGEASPVSITVNVVRGSQAIVFDSIPNKIYTANTSFALAATTSSGLPVSFLVVSGPATVSGNLLTLTGVGTVVVKARQTGSADYNAAPETTRSFCIGLRQMDAITGPSPACVSTQRYTTKKITGAWYQWSLDGGGTLTTSGDTAIVQWQTGGNHILAVKGYSACDTVRSAAQTLTVFVDTAYTVTAPTNLLPTNGSTGLAKPLTLKWTASPKATAYDIYVWPVGYAQPPVPLDSNLATVTYTVSDNISLNQVYNWRVVAKNVCTSAASAVQQFTVAEINNTLPDLVLDTMYFSQPLYQGQPVTVTWRVKNIGTKGTGTDAWKDRIYLSYSASIRVFESTLLGVFDNPSYLLPGESYTQTKTVTIPPGYGGTWWLSVITDNEEAFCFSDACNVFWGPQHYNHRSNNVYERNELNNYRYAVVSILDGPLPDLQVQSIGVPGALFGGSRFTVTYKVKNVGTAPAAGKVLNGCPQRAWRERFFITNTSEFNISTAKELGQDTTRFLKPGTIGCADETLPYIDYLLPDSSYTAQQLLTIPYDYFGKQYFWVYTNGYNDVYEGPFNTNNLRRTDSVNITLAAPADLVVNNIQNIPSYNSGNRVPIIYTVTNQGANEPLEEYWRDSIWICSSPTFSYGGVVVSGSVGIGRPGVFGTGNNYTGTIYLDLPNGISGTHYVFAKTDANREVFEYNQEGNNTTRSNAFTVNIGPLYDLLITSIAAPDTVTAGVPFNVSMTVKNAGSSTLTNSRWDHLYARTSTTPDPTGNDYILRFLTGDTLLPGGQRTYTGQAVISTYSQTIGRNAYIQAMTDATDITYEHNAEENNTFVRTTPVFVKPAPAPPTVDRRSNPGILAFTAANSVVAGDSVAFSFTIKNKGPLTTPKTYWYDRMYLSTDTIINSGDYQLAQGSYDKSVATGLLPDSSYTITGKAAIPLRLSGNWYLLLRSDAGNNIENDSTDSDNYRHLPISITVPPVPNLVMTPLNNLPDSIYGNSAFYLKYKVQNTGAITAGPAWYDRVYVVAGAVPEGYGLESNHHTTPLAPGAFYIDSILVKVPVYYDGAYNVILHTDGRDDIYEGPTGNADNLNVRPKTVYPYNSRPAPDLIVQSLTVPDSVVMGKDITTTFTIRNNSLTVPATGNLTNAAYLSTNAVFESSLDKLLSTAELPNILLQPGQSFQTQLTGKALPPVGGRYRSLIRTNSRNTLYEGPYITNNIKASDTTTYIEARSIALSNNVADTLLPNYGNHYKVTVAAGQDLLASLNTAYAGNGSTALYIGYNRVPDATNYDITGVNPAALNQQALLSNTQAGTYYIRTESFGIPVPVPATLRVDAIPYSIVTLSPAIMGQGFVTGTIRGGGFKLATQIVLRKNGTTYPVATVQQFINSTHLSVRWDTKAVPLGVYDVVAINPGGAEAVLTNGVTVETTREYKLEYTPLLPEYVRPFGGTYTYKGKNIGNVNIPVLQGDITVVARNARIAKVSTTGRIRRYTQYIPQQDSLIEQDWYTSGKNRVVPFIGRNLAPGEEFTITVDMRLSGGNVGTDQKNVFPVQCRMIGYSAKDFAKEQVRTFEMTRLLLLNDRRSAQLPNDSVIRGARAGSKFFAERMMLEYVRAGLLQWPDTIGTSFRWDCSRCLMGLPQVRPAGGGQDSITYSPAGEGVVGKLTRGTGQVFRPGESMLLEMNKGRYWSYYDGTAGAPGQPGESSGWDMLDINGTLFVDASAANPFRIYLASLYFEASAGRNKLQQLSGWNPAYDTTFLIVKASGGIAGYDAAKFKIDLTFFASLNPLRGGRFSTELRQGYGLGADSILLKWTAYIPGPGEKGVDGADGAAGEPGSPGGRGGAGNATHTKGGKGGNGGRGGDEYGYPPFLYRACRGGQGGPGGFGWGDGGDGGDAGPSGNGFLLKGADGETGGLGCSAGSHGGTGGIGGRGGDAGKSAATEGGLGGVGGAGGDGTNSSYGGSGGAGGDGGQGGSGCNEGLPGGGGGNGGTGGNGPLGSATYGASGKKGIFGPPIPCPPCSEPLPAGPDAAAAAAAAIDYGKAAYGLLEGDYLGAGTGLALEGINQGSNALEAMNIAESENAPSVSLAATGVDLYLAARLAANTATAEWTLMCKGTVAVLKIGDFIAKKTSRDGHYGLETEVKFLTDFFSTISSVPDLVAFGLKQLASLGGGLSFSLLTKPCDPNQITGPAGYAQPKFVNRNGAMPFLIEFENDSLLADVAAQRVLIRQPISPKADPITFKLGSFAFGGNTFEVPANVSNYFTTLNLDSLGYHVNVTAGVDIVKREAFWIFQTIDPATGLPPVNVFLGLLPVNDSLNRGHGFARYSIKPLATDITGDSITAKASIIFDENEPVETNTWVNVVDAYAPVSSLSGLPATSNNPVIPLHYNGVDDLGGSGLKYKNLYVSDNGATPLLYASNWTGTDTVFYGEQNHTYTFYGEATDNVLNKEELKNMGSVAITANSCLGNALSFTSNLTGSSYQWQVNTGSGWANISEGDLYTSTTNKTLVLINATGPMYGYQYRALVNGSTYSDVFTLRFATFWEGSISKDWNNPTNWSCGTVPNQYTDVVIPGSKQRYPEVTGNPVIRTLRANPGATVTVKAGAGITVTK